MGSEIRFLKIVGVVTEVARLEHAWWCPYCLIPTSWSHASLILSYPLSFSSLYLFIPLPLRELATISGEVIYYRSVRAWCPHSNTIWLILRIEITMTSYKVRSPHLLLVLDYQTTFCRISQVASRKLVIHTLPTAVSPRYGREHIRMNQDDSTQWALHLETGQHELTVLRGCDQGDQSGSWGSN